MSNRQEIIYRVSIKDITFNLSRNYTPYIDIVTETIDENKLIINLSYFFTNKSKYISYIQLISILNKFNIEVGEDNIFDSLTLLKGKTVYLMEEYDNKYKILKDYKDSSINDIL